MIVKLLPMNPFSHAYTTPYLSIDFTIVFVFQIHRKFASLDLHEMLLWALRSNTLLVKIKVQLLLIDLFFELLV